MSRFIFGSVLSLLFFGCASRKAPESATKKAEQKYAEARLLLTKKDFTGALKRYDEVIALAPSFAGVRINRANLLWQLGRLLEAQRAFDEGIQLNSQDAEAWYNRGSFHYDQKQFRKSFEDLVVATQLDPRDPEKWLNQGLALRELGKPREAILAFERALQLRPVFAYAAWQIGGSYLETLRDGKRAVLAFFHLLKVAPNQVGAWAATARALAETGKKTEANLYANIAVQMKREESSDADVQTFVAETLKHVPWFKEIPPTSKAMEAHCVVGREFFCYRIGRALMEEKKPEALPFLEKACKGGVIYACSDTGVAYRRFRNDLKIAEKFASDACEKTDAIGCFNAACFSCVLRQDDKALGYLIRAKNLGLDLSERLLKDSDLDCIRERPDFPQLRAALTE